MGVKVSLSKLKLFLISKAYFLFSFYFFYWQRLCKEFVLIINLINILNNFGKNSIEAVEFLFILTRKYSD